METITLIQTLEKIEETTEEKKNTAKLLEDYEYYRGQQDMLQYILQMMEEDGKKDFEEHIRNKTYSYIPYIDNKRQHPRGIRECDNCKTAVHYRDKYCPGCGKEFYSHIDNIFLGEQINKSDIPTSIREERIETDTTKITELLQTNQWIALSAEMKGGMMYITLVRLSRF